MKKSLALLVTVLGLATFTLPAQAADYTCITNNGAITITKYTGPGGNVTIPGEINGLPVTSIGGFAFLFCTSLSSVSIPNSVTNIGEGVFGSCTSLTNAVIANASAVLGSHVFSGCSSLPYARIGSGAMLLQRGSCDGSVTIQPTIDGLPVTHLGERLFSGCTNLTSVTIPNSVTTIGGGAFAFCRSLTSLSIPDSVTTIEDGRHPPGSEPGAFSDCTSLTNVTLGNSITHIGVRAFHNCASLTSISIPNSVTMVGGAVFYGCTNLTAAYFHGDAPRFSSEYNLPFFDCPNVIIYYLPGTTGWGTTYSGCPAARWLLPYPTILTTAPNFGVKTNAFGFRISWATNIPVVVEACTTLATPTWSPISTNNLTAGWCEYTDPRWTNYPARFYRLRSLSVDEQYTYVTNNGAITITRYTGSGGVVAIPEAINGLPVTSIESYAFEGCGSLTTVVIPNSVTRIGYEAFRYCTGLTSVTIGSSVTSIGGDAFSACTSLAAIEVDLANPTYSSVNGVLFNKNQTVLILCPQGKGGAYTIPNSVTSIAYWAFDGCFSLTSVTIGNSVTSIGGGAFWACTSLTNVIIPNSVTSIGDWAFSHCHSLTSITIPNSVFSIGDSAFEECTSLTSVVIPDSVTSIGPEAFYNCRSLTSITIGNRVTDIPDGGSFDGVFGVFAGCTSLTNAVIGNSVTNIGSCAFWDCRSLTSMNIPNSVTTIGNGAFAGCASLTEVSIPDSVTYIADAENDIGHGVLTPGAFEGCTHLTTVTFGKGATYVGTATFASCTNLQSAYFQGNAPSVGTSVFGEATNVTVYYLPGTTGWGTTFADRPTAPWLLPYPTILTTAPNFGVRTNTFGFRISWATNIPVVVEAATTLGNPVWSPVGTNTLTDGWSYFSDAEWTNYPARFYRVRQW